MPEVASPHTVRQTVGVFNTVGDLERAVEELQTAGFDHADIGLLTTDESVRERLQKGSADVRELKDAPEAAEAAFVNRNVVREGQTAAVGIPAYIAATAAAAAVVASGGALAAVLGAAAAAGGVGALAGGLLAKQLGDEHGERLQEQLDRGGLLLWVRTPDPEKEEKARRILEGNSAKDIGAHDLPVTA